MIPNLYTSGNAWLFHQKYIHFKLLVWGSRNPEPHRKLEYSTSWKGPAPSGFIIKSCRLPVVIGTKCCALLANPKKNMLSPRASKKRIQCSRWHPYSALKASFLFGEAPQRLKAKGFQNRLVSLKSPKEPKAPETLNSPARCVFFPKQRVPWPNCMACIILGFQKSTEYENHWCQKKSME